MAYSKPTASSDTAKNTAVEELLCNIDDRFDQLTDLMERVAVNTGTPHIPNRRRRSPQRLRTETTDDENVNDETTDTATVTLTPHPRPRVRLSPVGMVGSRRVSPPRTPNPRNTIEKRLSDALAPRTGQGNFVDAFARHVREVCRLYNISLSELTAQLNTAWHHGGSAPADASSIMGSKSGVGMHFINVIKGAVRTAYVQTRRKSNLPANKRSHNSATAPPVFLRVLGSLIHAVDPRYIDEDTGPAMMAVDNPFRQQKTHDNDLEMIIVGVILSSTEEDSQRGDGVKSSSGDEGQ